MKEFLKKYWMMAILLAAPLIRHFTENATIDGLTGLAVWSVLWVMFIIAVVAVGIGAACHIWSGDMKIDGLDKVTKTTFENMKWWKSLINASLVLSVYIYVDWSGPAILYTLSAIGMYAGISMIRSGMAKVVEAQTPVDSDEKPAELESA